MILGPFAPAEQKRDDDTEQHRAPQAVNINMSTISRALGCLLAVGLRNTRTNVRNLQSSFSRVRADEKNPPRGRIN